MKSFVSSMALLVAVSCAAPRAQADEPAGLGVATAPAVTAPGVTTAESDAIAAEYSRMFENPEFQKQLDAALTPRFEAQQRIVDGKIAGLRSEIPTVVAQAMKTEREGLVAAVGNTILPKIAAAQAASTAPPTTTAATAPATTTATAPATRTSTARAAVRDPYHTYLRHDQGNRYVAMPVDGFQACPTCGSTGACIENYNAGTQVASSGQPVRQSTGYVNSMPMPMSSGYYVQAPSSCATCNQDGSGCTSCQRSAMGW